MLLEKNLGRVAASFETGIGVEWMNGSRGRNNEVEENQVYISIHLHQWIREKKAGGKKDQNHMD